MNRNSGNPSRERGAALVVALLMLLVMTVLGIASMGVTRMEERMAGNTRDLDLAFQGAEAGLRNAEARLLPLTGLPPVTCTTLSASCTIYQTDRWATNDLRNEPYSWWVSNAREYGVSGTREVTDVTRDPRIVTEEVERVPDSLTHGHGPEEMRVFYRITSNSSGASDTANAILESTYTKRFWAQN